MPVHNLDGRWVVVGETTPQSAPMISAAELAGKVLARLGVSQVFGVVGSGNYLTTSALLQAGANFTGARHEGAAFCMADAYARVSNEVAVCSVHQGPGLTNTMTGLTDAAKYRSPVLVIAGQASATAASSNFSIDQASLVRSTGAISEVIRSATTVVDDTVRAYRRAVQERRPVVLNIPLDVQGFQVPGEFELASFSTDYTPSPSPESVAELAKLLSNSSRPLIVAGHGLRFTLGARETLHELARLSGGLLATSALANGFFEDTDWSLGILGGFSSDSTAKTVAEADLVVGFGVAFTSWTTRHEMAFAPKAQVVQVNAFPAVTELSPRVNQLVVGDAEVTAQLLVKSLDGLGKTRLYQKVHPAERSEEAREAPNALSAEEPEAAQLQPGQLTRELERLIPKERTLVVDGGHFIGWPITILTVPDPSGFVFSSAGFQSIGLGLGSAIGAHFARPDRLTVLATGDGGFLMGISELETLTRLNIPMLVIVYNDAAYGAEVHHFGKDNAGVSLVTFPDTDIAAIARGYGARAATIRKPEDLVAVAGWLKKSDGPVILDCKIDPTVVGYWAAQDFQGH